MRILVIDDDKSLRELVTDMLQSAGHEVQAARNGRDGLVAAIERPPDLVLCDISMPHFSGYDVLKGLRSNPSTATTLFIFLTAHEDRDSMRIGMSLGADDYLTKPFSYADLTNAINSQFKKRHTLANAHDTTLHTLRHNIIFSLPQDLRPPLDVLRGNTELLASYTGSLSQDEINEIATTIKDYASHLHDLFENYLIYAQIELTASDGKKIKQMRNHITAQAQQVIASAARDIALAASREHDIQIETQKLALQISEENLAKMTSELVHNALRYSRPGTPVYVRAHRSGDTFVLSVQSRGQGMTTEQIHGLSNHLPFEQTIFEHDGHGLGLRIAQRLAQIHSGRLTIDSTPGVGLTARVELPLYEGTPPTAEDCTPRPVQEAVNNVTAK